MYNSTLFPDFHLFDEWRSGYYTNTGAFTEDATSVANVNSISVSPSTTYYINLNSRYASGVRLVFRDEDKALISVNTKSSSAAFTTPNNCHYLDFGTFPESGISGYNNDICINVSGIHDGEYVPYNG